MSRPTPVRGNRAIDAGSAADSVDIAWFTRAYVLTGGLFLSAFGIAAVVGAIAGLTTDPSSVAERVVTAVLGGIFLAIGAGLLFWRLYRPPDSVLEADAAGLRVSDRGTVTWSLDWNALAHLELVRAAGTFRLAVGGAGSGPWSYVRLPRHYLVLHLQRGTACPEPLHSAGVPNVDLGVLPSTARRVAAALGTRLADPQPRRLDAAETERVLR